MTNNLWITREVLNCLFGPSHAIARAAEAWSISPNTVKAWVDGKRCPSARARVLILRSLDEAAGAIDAQTARQLELMRQHGEERKRAAEAYRLAFALRHKATPHKIYSKPEQQWIKP